MNESLESGQHKVTSVGYCNPPKHTRFRKGQSGNPKGRPRGTLNMATVLERTLRERVVINENGKRKTITKLEAAVKQLTNKAASGDMKAFSLLTALVRSAEERGVQASNLQPALEPDEKAISVILGRWEAAKEQQRDEQKDRPAAQ